jgi:hypothetical protein
MTVASLLKNAVPLSEERHGDHFLNPVKGYAFARDIPVVPALAREFADLAGDYVIGFMQTPDGVRAVALLGLGDGENLYLEQDGSWRVAYVPAMLRQYPFVAMVQKGQSNGVLGIVEDYEGLNKNGQGAPLFDEDGRPGGLVSRAQSFVADVAQGALRTDAICARLADLGLLASIRADIRNKAGQGRRITGVMAVDRKAFEALDGDTLKTLQGEGALEAIYQHLASLRNMRKLAERIEFAPPPVLN